MTRTLRSLSALLLAASCASDAPEPDATSPDPPPVVTPSLSLEPWPAPELTVVSTGGEPREVLVVPIDQPAPEATVAWQSTFRTTATRGSVTTDPVVIHQDRTFRVATTAGRPATFDFTVTAAEDRASSGPPVDPSVPAALRGRSGRWTADAHCRVTAGAIDRSEAGPAEPHLTGLLRTAVELCPVLPTEALGIGARWTTHETRPDGRVIDTEWVLVHRDDQQVAITFQTRSPDQAAQMLADGRVAIDRHHPVPVRFDATGRSTRARPDPDRPGSTLEWATEWEMHAVRTLGTP